MNKAASETDASTIDNSSAENGNQSRFTYSTYIRTTTEKLWDGLTRPEFTRRYWCGTWQDTTWAAGASWAMMIPDGRVGDAGEVVEIKKPSRLVLKWRNEFQPELKKEGFSLCTFELEEMGEMVKLVVTHEMPMKNSVLISKVSEGWPMILASLKSLLETGEALEATSKWPEGI